MRKNYTNEIYAGLIFFNYWFLIDIFQGLVMEGLFGRLYTHCIYSGNVVLWELTKSTPTN